ncbi:HAMP domain-containing histidine kinase [Mucilaginibacter sp. HC2]|uniref:sensor histidine kinase n=1 Tax=Mucilaginibacter inviolabilis TaxID=2714892 RepID=UPI0014095903|nr:HAMP domain-containing sensor histidine kinase [Mucilaginibacter inviolabilis]NHA02638.1 HAMP domain-containing histidine kinase [Mucilaginibacter inviolabilis]
MTDIHEQEQARLSMQRLMEQKDEFISIASHELKTPLTTVKAFFQLVRREMDPANRLAALSVKAGNQLDRLDRLVNELLDVSRLNAGKMTYNFEEFDLAELVEECLDNMRESHPRVLFLMEGCILPQVCADRHRIEQLLMNLLGNAVKYAPDGPEVRLFCSDLGGQVEISVQDYGIGISAEDLAHLFERFYRAGAAVDRFQGLGLGLFISAEIIRRHGGLIRAASEPGKGSTFTFTLPLHPPGEGVAERN